MVANWLCASLQYWCQTQTQPGLFFCESDKGHLTADLKQFSRTPKCSAAPKLSVAVMHSHFLEGVGVRAP
jgi:hypothetical protein